MARILGVQMLVFGGVAPKKISYILIIMVFYHDILSVIHVDFYQDIMTYS